MASSEVAEQLRRQGGDDEELVRRRGVSHRHFPATERTLAHTIIAPKKEIMIPNPRII